LKDNYVQLNDQPDIFILFNEMKFQRIKQNRLYFARDIIKKSLVVS